MKFVLNQNLQESCFHRWKETNSELLDLIHSDVCDMKSTPTRGGKKYFVTFIDDCNNIAMFIYYIVKMRP